MERGGEGNGKGRVGETICLKYHPETNKLGAIIHHEEEYFQGSTLNNPPTRGFNAVQLSVMRTRPNSSEQDQDQDQSNKTKTKTKITRLSVFRWFEAASDDSTTFLQNSMHFVDHSDTMIEMIRSLLKNKGH